MSLEKMRVIAMGGCGGMGRFAVQTALTFDFVDQIVVADRNGEAAATFTEECGPKATHQEIDVQDYSKLVGLLKGADVVLADVGPYYKFGMPVLRAAIETGCHYIDINDDWEPTLEMLDLDEEARKAGITALIGMGASPGQSNMLASKAISLLDSVDTLITGWGAGGGGRRRRQTSSEGSTQPQTSRLRRTASAATVHWLHQLTGKIRVRQNGQFIDVPPIQEIEIDYPDIGLGKAYTVGHPEPLTLPRYHTGIKNSCNVMVITESYVNFLKEFAAEVDAGRMTVDEAADALTNPTESQRERLIQEEPEDLERPRLPGLFAYAKGLKDDRPTTVGVTVSAGVGGGMGGATGVPQAIGLKMLAEGRITRTGVFAPEADVDPDEFFDELGPRCATPRANAKDMLIIGRSSD